MDRNTGEDDAEASREAIQKSDGEEKSGTIRSRASQTILTSSRSLRVSLDATKSTAVMPRTASVRSLDEIPSRIGSSSAPPAPQEIVTLTMDYESLPIERNSGSRSNNANDAVGVTDSPEIGSARRDAVTDSPPPTIYSFVERPRIPRRSRWTLLCWTATGRRRRGAFLDSDRRAPPAYSALFPRYGRRAEDFEALVGTDRAAVLINGNPSTFDAPTPPPSYAQDQGICVAYSLEQLISNSASNGRFSTPRPTTAVCPRCATLVITVVDVQQATATHVTALALCLMGCWPCCVLPYCIDSCKTSHHYCPFCRAYLGTYIPW